MYRPHNFEERLIIISRLLSGQPLFLKNTYCNVYLFIIKYYFYSYNFFVIITLLLVNILNENKINPLFQTYLILKRNYCYSFFSYFGISLHIF